MRRWWRPETLIVAGLVPMPIGMAGLIVTSR